VIHILADKNIFQLEKFLPENVNYTLFDPNNALPDDLSPYSAILIRTVTRINEHTFTRIPGNLTFIGTASSGTDHVDISYLHSNNITFSSAAGCNARAVAEYIATAINLWGESRSTDITKYTVGIIGVGHVGSVVYELLTKTGIETILYDPPREMREPNFKSASLKGILASDILTFHVPLETAGQFATYHWLNEAKLNNREYKLIINASRGGVIDEKILADQFKLGKIGDYILDVWENEPSFSVEIAENAFIATPHIAGYSYQAKQNATRMICNAMLDHFGLAGSNSDINHENIITPDLPDGSSLSKILTSIHPIRDYDHKLRKIFQLPENKRGQAFRDLRTGHPYRMEYSQICLPENVLKKYPVLEKLGIEHGAKN
jgi:erythronate-4-phosphate dehydrogenase